MQCSRLFMQVVTRGHQYQPQNISNIAWTFASWDYRPSPAMFDAIERHLLEGLKDYSAQVHASLLPSFRLQQIS